MIKQLAHVCIHAEDLTVTETFYVEVLGLERGFTFMKDGTEVGFYIKLGASTFIEVFQGKPSDEGSIKHFAIEVDDIDTVINKLRSHGCEATDKKLGIDHSWQSWTQDPNGIRIEFHQYTADSLQLKGGIGEVNW
jgi:catechol 2,3-dioxygenase-like lactoylglutathione lyase family enzyme